MQSISEALRNATRETLAEVLAADLADRLTDQIMDRIRPELVDALTGFLGFDPMLDTRGAKSKARGAEPVRVRGAGKRRVEDDVEGVGMDISSMQTPAIAEA
jgi:hypothetical protein